MTDLLITMTPFILASIGGLYSEYAGTTNVAIEGYMTLGAFLIVALTRVTDSFPLGMILTLSIIGSVSYIHSFLTLKLRANPIITGLAVNMGFFGLISTLSNKLFYTKGVILLNRSSPIESWPIITVALLLPIATHIIIKHSRYGLRLRANGLNRKLLQYSNISSDFYFITSLIVSAVFSAIAGIFLALELRSYTPNMSAGRGWISLVIIFLGRKNPFGIVIGCFIFAITQLISNRSQGELIPSDLVLAIPYILTLLALIAAQVNRRKA